MSSSRRFSTSPAGRDAATTALLGRPTSATSSASSPARSAAAAAVDGAPAYLMEWGPGFCTRTALPTAEALRAAVVRGRAATDGGSKRLLVVRGLPVDLVRTLRTSVDIDPAFLEAHARRIRYRPLRWRRDARFGGWVVPELVDGFRACWVAKEHGGGARQKPRYHAAAAGGGGAVGMKSVYPIGDGVTGTKPMISSVSGDGGGGDAATETAGEKPAVGTRGLNDGDATRGMTDLMGEPAMRAISEDGDTAAVFGRASLWLGSDGLDVLLVDRPVWTDANSPLRKTRRSGGGGGGGMASLLAQPRPGFVDRRDSLEVRIAEADEMGSLEDDLYMALKDAADAGESLLEIVDELAYDHWLDFFETLSPKLPGHAAAAHSLYLDVAQSLEQTLAVANYIHRRDPRPQPPYPDWQALLARLQRRVALLLHPTLGKPAFSKPVGATRAKLSRQPTLASAGGGGGGGGGSGVGGGGASPSGPEDENQRALNRVSYLGGFLLPLTIVSSVLSMSDPFGPTDSLFWVFWAAAVPLTVFSVFVIYADIIRKAEVWVEVAAEGVQNAIQQQQEAYAARTKLAAAVTASTDVEDDAAVGGGSSSQQPKPFRVETDPQRRKWSWYRLHKVDDLPGAGGSNRRGVRRRKGPKCAPYDDGDEAVVIDIPPSVDDIGPGGGAVGESMLRSDEGGATAQAEVGSDDDDDNDDDNGEREEGEDIVEPTMILERPSGGAKPKAWRRQQLGWYGAAKMIVGYQRPRRTEDILFSSSGPRRQRTF